MRVLIAFWLCVAAGMASAQPVIINTVGQTVQPRDKIRYLIDSVGLTVDNVQTSNFVDHIDPSYYRYPNVFFWLRFSLKNETNASQFVITIDQWNDAVLYHQQDGQWLTMSSGTSVLVNKRPLSLHRLISFPIVLAPGETKEIFIRTRIHDSLMRYYANMFTFLSKVEVDEAAHAYKKYMGNQLLVVFIMGVAIVLFLYNLMLYFFDHQRTSLILSLYFISISISIANIHGIATNYLFRGFTGFEMHLALHLAHIIPIIVASFLFSYFKLGFKSWEGILLTGFVLFMVSSWIISVASDQSLFFVARRYVEYITFIIVVISCIVKKKAGSRIIFLALLVTITVSYFADLRLLFFQQSDFISPDIPYLIGVFAQVIIFSIAATYRVRSLEKGVRTMAWQQQQLIEQQNENLKVQVTEKTQQLQSALHTLQHQKEQLERVNSELSAQTDSVRELNNQLETLVQNRTAALEATMRDLDTFLYRTSHDLRRPLMTIRGITDLIHREANQESVATLTALIDRTVNDLDRVLKKLMAISMCYHETLELEDFSVPALIQDVMGAVAKENPNQTVSIELALPANMIIQGNPWLVRDICKSILENAVQYGATTIRITAQPIADGRVALSFSDDGAGIQEQYHRSVFDMFFRASERSTGNGLGLYLVKIGMERLKGTVHLQSAMGKGTTITIVLPLVYP
jgi:signal transduction histidine kinase